MKCNVLPSLFIPLFLLTQTAQSQQLWEYRDTAGGVRRANYLFPSPSGMYLIGLASFTLTTATNNPPETAKPLSIMPNPAQDAIFWNLPAGEKALRVFLTNVSGQLVRETAGPTAGLQIGDLPAGLYLLGIQTADAWYQGKVLKQK